MNAPGVFRKRPATVEAWQWDGSPECAELIVDWVESNNGFAGREGHTIVLGEQIAPVKPGDWVIHDKFGEFWPLGEDIFDSVYASLL